MKVKLFLIAIAACLLLENSFLHAQSPEQRIIYKIIFKGLYKTKKKDVQSTIFSQEGSPLDLGLVDDDYKALLALGYFEEIYISSENAVDEKTKQEIQGMANLIFEFVEKPIIRKTIFKGNKSVSFGFLIDDIKIKRGDILDKQIILNDIKAIIEEYHKKGFSYVKVDYEIFSNEELKQRNQVDIIFNITEGIEAYISEIIINGNKNISSFTIKNKMKTKERKFLGLVKGVFVESDFQQDIDDLKKFYKDQGYYLVEIKQPEIYRFEQITEQGQKKEVIRINISIKEGNQYTFAGMTITGNKLFSEEDLTFGFKLKKGQIFNYSKFQESLFTLQSKYTNSGYVQTEITDNEIIDNESKSIKVEINIKESKRSYIEAVYFKGNEKTRNYVLERLVLTEVGEIFNSAKLMDSLIMLYNTAFFMNVNYDIQEGSAPGLLKITYILEEQQTAELKFGLQIPASTDILFGITLFAEIAEKNFVGRALYLSGKIDASAGKQGFSLTLRDSDFYNLPILLGFSINFYHDWIRKVIRKLSAAELNGKSEEDVREEYNQETEDRYNKNYLGTDNKKLEDMGIHDVRFLISAESGYRFLKYFGIYGSLSVSPIYYWLAYNTKSQESIDEIYDATLRSAINDWRVKANQTTTFSIDTTKIRVNPYEGLRYSFTFGYTFGHYDTVVLKTKFTYYWKIFDIYFNDWPFKQVIAFNVGVSMLLPGFRNIAEKNGPVVHSDDYLLVEGLFSGRGWSNTLNGAKLFDSRLGYLRFDFSLEYRVPIYDKIIWTAFFIDAVNLTAGSTEETKWQWWNNKNAMGIDNWYFSIGAGVEVTFPQLPLSFFVVKRFKINYFTGIEWQNSRDTNVDFVLSMVGFYF